MQGPRPIQHFPRQPALLEPPAFSSSFFLPGKPQAKQSNRGSPGKKKDEEKAGGDGASSASALQQLVERQIKFVGQRAMWRAAPQT